MQILCTICTDLVNPAENLHATNCGHLFHYHCLSEWMLRSNTCPQCRRLVTVSGIFRVYPTISDEIPREIALLQSQLDEATKACEIHMENEELLKVYSLELDNRNTELKNLKSSMHDEIMTKLKYIELHKKLTEEIEKMTFNANVEKLEHCKVLGQNLNKLRMQNYETLRFKKEGDIMKKNIQLLKKTLLKSEFEKKELRSKVILAENASISEKFISLSQQLKLGQISQQNLVRTLVRIHTLLLSSKMPNNNTDKNNVIANLSVILEKSAVIEAKLSEHPKTEINKVLGNTSANLNMNKIRVDTGSQNSGIFSKDVSNVAPILNVNVYTFGSQFPTITNSANRYFVKGIPNLNLNIVTGSQYPGTSKSKSNDVVKEKSNVFTFMPSQNESIFINRNTSNESLNLKSNVATGSHNFVLSNSSNKDIVKETPNLNLNVSQYSGNSNSEYMAKGGATEDIINTSVSTPEQSTPNLKTVELGTHSPKEGILGQNVVKPTSVKAKVSTTKCTPKRSKSLSSRQPQNQHLDNLASSLSKGLHLEVNPQQSKSERKSEPVFKFTSLGSENNSIKYNNPHQSKVTLSKENFKRPKDPWFEIAKYALSRSLTENDESTNDDGYRDYYHLLEEFAKSKANINWPKTFQSEMPSSHTEREFPNVADGASTSQIEKPSLTSNEKPLFDMFLKRFEKQKLGIDNNECVMDRKVGPKHSKYFDYRSQNINERN